VVEQGHSQYPSSYGDPLVSYGVVLENTSDQIATNVSVEVTLMGVTEPTPEASPVEIPVLMPGQRVGVGHTAYDDASAMTGMDVAVDATQWWPPDLRSIELGDISVSELTISPAGDGTLTFTLDSTVPVYEGGTFHAVLRDASGTIVGGGNDVGNVSPGRSFAALDPYTGALPPSADAGTSQVWFQP
jgi:hypothetical protein